MKNLGISLAVALVLSTQAYAYMHKKTEQPENPRSSADVYLSNPPFTFDIGFDAMWLQPYGNLDYAAEAFPEPAPSPHWKIYSIDPDYHFGFDVGMQGVFHSLNTNLMLDWQHFHSSDGAKKKVPDDDMIGPFFEIGPDATDYKMAKGRAIFHFDQVDLDYGIFLNLGDRFRTNLFGGVAFARIRETLLSKFSSPDGSTVRHLKVPSTFVGAGPQLGMDFCYRIACGLLLTGQGVGSLFVGPQKSHTKYIAKSPLLPVEGVTSPNEQTTYGREKTQVVPGFQGKIGLAYCLEFCKHYMVTIAAGYEAQVYLNAIQSIDIGSEVDTPPVIPDTIGVFARTFRQNLNNFSLAGPYLTVDIGF